MTDLPISIHKAAAKHSDPLYLSQPWMQGGHTSQKANGTLTYVQYRGNLYGITCAHIYQAQFTTEPNMWLTIHGKERYVYQTGSFAPEGYKSSFRPLRKAGEMDGPDIAILPLDNSFKQIHLARKEKAPIDLDTWAEPNWSDLTAPVAFGYPTEHKTDTEEFLQAPLAAVVAELTSPISPSNESFLMASSLPFENSFYFSGMSGGAVYAVSESEPQLTLVGIVFEGSPGSSQEWESRGEESFLTKSDIQIRAHTLTPTIFDKWLDLAGLK